jgi:predicted DNA-binding transcriptional regulator AlpA
MKSSKTKRRPPAPRRPMQPVADSSDPPAQHHTTEPVKFLSKAEVAELIGFTTVTVWKWICAGNFPRGLEVGGKTMWRADEIARWQNERPTARVKNARS